MVSGFVAVIKVEDASTPPSPHPPTHSKQCWINWNGLRIFSQNIIHKIKPSSVHLAKSNHMSGKTSCLDEANRITTMFDFQKCVLWGTDMKHHADWMNEKLQQFYKHLQYLPLNSDDCILYKYIFVICWTILIQSS